MPVGRHNSKRKWLVRMAVRFGSVSRSGPSTTTRAAITHSVAVGADITAKRIETHKKQELQDKLLAEMKERERMVIELQLAQKLESVGRLAAGIAHEINTPIQYVGDSVHFLRSAFEDFDKLFESMQRAAAMLPDGAQREAYQAGTLPSWKRNTMSSICAPRSRKRSPGPSTVSRESPILSKR